jgi:hypothetical protein
MQGELAKLEIITYKDSSYNNKVSSNAFNAFINPENYSVTYKTEFDSQQSIGTPKSEQRYIASPPTEKQWK